MSIPRVNNFDLVRLLAASQVVVAHICTEVGPSAADKLRPVVWWLAYFPGVPEFFTVSGFLIFWSFERNADRVGEFYKNRFLRIYPALWVSFAVTIAILAAFQQISTATLGRSDFWTWVVRQMTFFQFGTPECFKHWGDGQVNRSLWTISVELQFYAAVPLIYYIFKKLGKLWAAGWAALFFGSIGVYVWQSHLLKENIFHVIKDVGLTSCLYNFLFGIAFYKCWERVRTLVEGRFFYWLAAYVVFILLMAEGSDTWPYSPVAFAARALAKTGARYEVWPYSPEPIRLLGYFLLSGLTISLAFSFRELSERLIRGFDISYGVYIYHGLVLNCFIVFGWMSRWESAILVLPITWAIGAASWVLVERPMLRRKHRTLRGCPASVPAIQEKAAVSAAGAA
jgi:peptidoglycan/LPS O-acetylase OafA/YrhL